MIYTFKHKKTNQRLYVQADNEQLAWVFIVDEVGDLFNWELIDPQSDD